MKSKTRNPLRPNWLALAGMALVALASLGAAAGASQAQDGREVVVVDADGPVFPPFRAYIERGMREAVDRDAEALVIVLDTPGGDATVTTEIVQDIRTSSVPVIVFVGPAGAQAASAGTVITLAGHVAAMAPETAIGAASPVGAQGEDLPETLQTKAIEILSAQARGLAERRGPEAVKLADEAVRQARAVSASEAQEANFIDFIARDVDDLLRQADGFEVEVGGEKRILHTAGATQVPVSKTFPEELLIALTNPNIVLLLLTIGVNAVIIEISSPGGWVAGTIGVICLGLAFYGLGVIPVNWLGMVFVILAFVLFLLDIKAPTHGALTAAAIGSLIAGSILMFSRPAAKPFGSLSIPLVVGDAIVVGAFFFFVISKALQAQSRRPTTGREGLIGRTGRVSKAIDPEGIAVIFGERWRAVAEAGSGPIPKGVTVEVVSVSGYVVTVRPADSPAQSSSGAA
jgi:membrane-bound serine protease (ClpP class)